MSASWRFTRGADPRARHREGTGPAFAPGWAVHIALAAAWLLVAAAPAGVRAAQLAGFYKTFIVVYDLPGALQETAGYDESLIGSANQRLRLDLGHRFSDRGRLDVSYELVPFVQDPLLFEDDPFFFGFNALSYRFADLEPVLFPDEVNSFAVFQNLDRVLLTINFPAFDLYVGRQAIAWGSARTVNPTDVIAPFAYNTIDVENRIGVDAARLRVPVGSLGEVDAGYVAGKDFEFAESAFFLRSKNYVEKADLSLLVIGFRENVLVGIDAVRAIGGAGTWVEGAYVFVDALDERRSQDDYLRVTAGGDYSLGSGTYLYGEYHFNGAGATSPAEYASLPDTPAYTDGAVFLFGRHYLSSGAVFQVTPLIAVTSGLIINLTDPSALLLASAEYNFRDDVYLDLGLYLGVGKAPTLTGVPQEPIAFESEFGVYTDTVYSAVRVYF